MSEAEVVTSFTMYSARSAIAGGLSHIGEHVDGIERAVIENAAVIGRRSEERRP